MVSLFENAHQFDPVERSQLQIAFEICAVAVRRIRNSPSGNARDDSSQGIGTPGSPGSSVAGVQDKLANPREHRLLGGRPRKIRLWPHEPVADLLIFGKRSIRGLYRESRPGFGRPAHQQYRVRFLVGIAFDPQYDAIADVQLRSQRFFEIFGIDIHTCRGHDDIFSPAPEIQPATLVLVRYVARSEPSIRPRQRAQLAVLTIG